jgi:hypothetical protein
MAAPSTSSPVLDTLQDIAIGAGNTGLGMVNAPSLDAVGALLNKRMYLQYDKQKKSPDLMSLSPSSATAAQKAINTVTAITGTSSIVPTQGYRDDGQYNIARSILDYLTQGAVKQDTIKAKGFKSTKARHR